MRWRSAHDTAKQAARQLLELAEVGLAYKRMYRAFLFCGELL